MHIVDGVLAAPVIVAGTGLTLVGVARGLKDLELERIPAAGVLSATFFVAALIHIPVGPASVHLLLIGLVGLVLGWAAFPALFIALLLQSVFFGFGGVTALGVNTLVLAGPAVLVHYLCRRGVRLARAPVASAWGAFGGGVAILLAVGAVALALALSGEHYWPVAKLILLAHLPVMVVEALLCAAAVTLIRLVKPELFGQPTGAVARNLHG